MRQIATLTDSSRAHALADYLLTLRIETKLSPEAGGWEVWVCDEDRVAQARKELETFNSNPSDPRYAEAARAAEALRRQESRADEAYVRKQVNLGERLRNPTAASRPWTAALLAGSILATLAAGGLTEFTTQPEEPTNPVLQALSIASFRVGGGMIRWDDLEEIRNGQLWRLVSPIFLHFGFLHLVFNMWMLHQLGGLVEARRGGGRFLLLVLGTAVASNLGQYYLGHPSLAGGLHLRPGPPTFGGMSGVLYGLFGYAWMKSRFDPGLGILIHPNTVIILMAWFFICMAGWAGPIGNAAHAVGLSTGLAVGYAPVLWRKIRRG